jgi:hypothetical protein
MADPAKRLEAWRIKATPERTKQVLEARHADMLRRYEAQMTALYISESKVRQVLNQSGVHTSFYVPYLNYGRQLWKLSNQREISGDSFAMAAKVLLDKWAARGLNPDVLADIRTQVFDAVAPAP